MEVQIFHQGLNKNTQQLIDSKVRGLLGCKTLKITKKLIKETAMNNY